mmetsp:Transcript_53316/g.98586  ORF Transcript_53316/g.98586 Transcript_53316/m.98586 type:complete len:182 (-) Transcript_53316:1-546(-)
MITTREMGQCIVDECEGDREWLIEAVSVNGWVLKYADAHFCSDHAIVLAAVKSYGMAFYCTTEHLQHDREIVLAAVTSDPNVIKAAPTEFRNDRELMQIALEHMRDLVPYASSELLEDATFARQAKAEWYLFKVYVLSGRSCCVALPPMSSARGTDIRALLMWECCERLGLEHSGMERLFF